MYILDEQSIEIKKDGWERPLMIMMMMMMDKSMSKSSKYAIIC